MATPQNPTPPRTNPKSDPNRSAQPPQQNPKPDRKTRDIDGDEPEQKAPKGSESGEKSGGNC
jgi:hypothetical protein